MNEKTKKQISLWYSIILIVLAAVFVVISVTPAIVIDAGELEYPEIYYTGRFTANADTPNEVGVGFCTLVPVAMNFNDIVTVIGLQALDGNIKTQQEYISELASNEGTSKERLDRERQDLEDMIKDRDEMLADLTEEDFQRIEDKLQNDENFIKIIGTIYGLIGKMGNSLESSVDNYSNLGITTLQITITILSVILLICLIGVTLVFPIVIIVKFIILLVASLKHIKDGDMEATDNRMDKFPFTAYAAIMLVFYMLYALVSTGLGMGTAIKGAVIVLIVVCLLRAVKTILFAEKDRALIITKQAITLVSVIAIMLLLFNFVGLDLINEFDDVIVDISQKQYDAVIDDLADSGMENHEIVKAAESAVSSSNGWNTAIVVVLALVGAMMTVIAVICAIERFGNRKTKMKTGELAPYKAMVVLSVFLLIFAIIPSVFAVDSAEAQEDAYKEGQFKIWYGEYLEDGTAANLEYEVLKDLQYEGENELKELREEYADADAEKKEELAETIEDAEYTLKSVNNKIKDIEARTTRPTACIIFAVLFLIAEYAYFFVPKILSKNKKKEDGDTPAEAEPVPAAE